MAISLRHGFTSGKLDGTDATLVQPSNWNSVHTLSIAAPKLFGRTTTTTASSPSITAISKANPGVFTSTNTLSVGQIITITGVNGMTEVNSPSGSFYVVNTASASQFTVSVQGTPLDTSAFTTYTSGGTVTAQANGVAEEIAVTGTGSAVLATTPTITNPTVTNYVETLFPATTGSGITLDLANGTVQNLTLSATATITMPTAVAGKSFIIILTQNGGFTVTWSTVSWPSGTPPTLTSTAARKDIFSFFSNGSSWFGTTIGQNYT
jgi:hypothetical protein